MIVLQFKIDGTAWACSMIVNANLSGKLPIWLSLELANGLPVLYAQEV